MGILAGDQQGGAVLTARAAGPTLSRLILGTRLRRLRADHMLTERQAAGAIGTTEAAIGMLERGRTEVRLRTVIDLCDLYGIDDLAERATLLGLARQSNITGWWSPYRSVIPSWFELFLGLEQTAGVIRGYTTQFIPELLQTAEYAEALLAGDHGDAPSLERRLRLELRMRRQEIIRQDHSPHVWMVVDEAALHRRVGSRATMFRQLEHLLDLCELPRITIQILRLASGAHPATGGSITLLQLPEPGLHDVVYLEQLTSALYLDQVNEVCHYRHVLNILATQASLPGDTVPLLRRFIREL